MAANKPANQPNPSYAHLSKKAQAYMTDRVDKQRTYYSEKSGKYKKWYLFLKILEVGLAASVGFVASFAAVDNGKCFAIAASAIGVVIVISSGIRQVLRFQESWTNYRKASEAIKREKYLYLNSVAPYKGTDAFDIFVTRVEGIISEENGSWVSYQNSGGAANGEGAALAVPPPNTINPPPTVNPDPPATEDLETIEAADVTASDENADAPEIEEEK